MPFLSGNLTFERFRVLNFSDQSFGQEHLELMQQAAAGQVETSAEENVHVGFLGGDHLFDQDFDLTKNVIDDTLHFGMRIDTNQVPAPIKKAWLQMELAGILRDSPTGRPTKSQRQEAKEAVEHRCEVEAATGKYRKQQAFDLLWDLRHEMLYFGGSAGGACGHCLGLVERIMGVEFEHVSAGAIARGWATAADRFAELDDCLPESFHTEHAIGTLAWANEHSAMPDFLGNEFLLWLWWRLENQTDTLTLLDESEVTLMLAKTLTLECPIGESGKETISSDFPTKLPEAMRAIQSGKWPRKAGLTMITQGRKFDLTLQAESFSISGAKIHLEEGEEFGNEDRINAIRLLGDTVDGMLGAYCNHRTSQAWNETLASIRRWLAPTSSGKQRAA